MTNLSKNTARAALIALIASAPMAALAEIKTGSPAQSVAADPNEYVEPDTGANTAGESMEDTPKADQGSEAYKPADVVDDIDGSLIEDDAKRDG
ncbi:hypothetical protein [uncultured Sulfitobacter sp.]|uniref:hypothetical protein n=1 Tax=uncultured Sulfitobacter sp. TaxID=191468 RepID=UPI002632152A|nr:hypothetical protein [uncultured Sulfitobacter sp.]